MDAELERIFAVLDANWPLHSSPLLSLYAFRRLPRQQESLKML
jgi:hypothetical protein